MKRIWKYLFLFFVVNAMQQSISIGQNLVPNPSFEIYDTCPNAQDQIERAIGWIKYSAAITTPDYYNSCAPQGTFSVPSNALGYQTERRNCNAYAGIVTYFTNNYREDIGIKLTQPLIIGQKYFLSFYTVMSQVHIGTNYYGMPSDKIGIRLSTVAYNGSSPAPKDNFAHLYSKVIISDSINWTLVTGNIAADSAYSFLIVGNFFDNANTDTLHIDTCSLCYNSQSYYYIDDICLSTDSTLCNSGLSESPCDNKVKEITFKDDINVLPNPASDYLSILFQNNVIAELAMYNIMGSMIYSDKIKNANRTNINLIPYSSGTYFLKIIYGSNKIPIIKEIIKL